MNLPQDKYIVITGGAGFIGSAVIRYLNEQNFSEIVVVDELDSSDKWKNLVGKQFAEILEKDQLFPWLEGKEECVQAFIHLGACSSTVEADSRYLLINNYQYTQRLAEYALEHGQRFIYASSAATYGDGSQGFSDDHDLLETLRPLNMYGYSKHLFDLWAKRQGILGQIVGLKYFNVFGPNEYHKGRMASGALHFFGQALKEGSVRLFQSSSPEHFADGDQKRDFIYVKDAARMTCAFLDPHCSDRGIFNIGTGVPGTWNTIAKSVFRALDREENIEYIPMPPDLVGKYQNYTCADMTKHKNSLLLSAECTDLADAVVDYCSNYLIEENRW